MSEELERLKADLAIFNRYSPDWTAKTTVEWIEAEIARLEADANPWRDAKEFYEELRQFPNKTSKAERAIRYYDHLTSRVEAQKRQIDYLHKEYDNRGLQISELVADNDRLEKRAKELDAARNIVRRLATHTSERQLLVLIEDAQKLWSEMQREKGAGNE